MDSFQRMVLEFHQACGLGAPERPTLEGFPGPLRIGLIEEEAAEFAQATMAGDMVGMIDALCDLLYVTYGAAVCLGVDLEPFFREVHRANMAKQGGPLREDGKQLKPPGWQPPRIRELLEDQVGRASQTRGGARPRGVSAERGRSRTNPAGRQGRATDGG